MIKKLKVMSYLWTICIFSSVCSSSLYAYDDSAYSYDTLANVSNIKYTFQGRYEIFPIHIQLGLDYNFDSTEEEIIRRATEIFVERALTERVVKCAYSKSEKDKPSDITSFKYNLLEALRPMPLADLTVPSMLFIGRFVDEEKKAVGLAYNNLFYATDKPYPGFKNRHYLYIALNPDFLGSADYVYGTSPEYWAGVIGHEILHNLGYGHPTGYDLSFIREYGECIHSNGTSAEYRYDYHDKEVQLEL